MPSKFENKKKRREVKKGYPKTFIFDTPERLADYFSGDKIVCLQCGKQYRSLGNHLATIHDMSPDEYRSLYGIPWGKGLTCSETRTLYSELAIQKREDGILKPISEDTLKALISSNANIRERAPVLEVITKRNLDIMNAGKTGEVSAYRRSRPKLGSVSNIANRVAMQKQRCKEDPSIIENMANKTRGKKQTEDHIRKRIENRLKTIAMNKAKKQILNQ